MDTSIAVVGSRRKEEATADYGGNFSLDGSPAQRFVLAEDHASLSAQTNQCVPCAADKRRDTFCTGPGVVCARNRA